MNAQSYWQSRTQKRFLKAEADINFAEKQMISAFEKAKRDIETQINAFYGRYAKNNKVSWEDAQKALSLEELKSFKDDLEGFKRLAKQNIGKFSLEVDNLSVQARVTRLQALRAQSDAILEKLYQSQDKAIGGLATEVYTDQYHRTLYDIDQYSGFHHQFAQINDTAMRKVISYPFDGLSFSERIWRQADDLTTQVQQTIGQMLVTGKHPKDYAKDFATRFGVKEKEAYRLLYTENAFVATQAHLTAYEEDGIERYLFDATLDTTTCEVCGALDGKMLQIKDAKPGINAPPMHPYCRCVAVPVVEGVTIGGERFARDKDGKSIQVPGTMTYEQWKKQYVKPSTKVPKSGIINTKDKLGKPDPPQRFPTSQKEIDTIIGGELKGVRFSCEVAYNPLLRSCYGVTKTRISPSGRIISQTIEIGKQRRPSKTELMDTLIHEELEARIVRRAYQKRVPKYIQMDKQGERGTHPYILPRVKRFLRLKGMI